MTANSTAYVEGRLRKKCAIKFINALVHRVGADFLLYYFRLALRTTLP